MKLKIHRFFFAFIFLLITIFSFSAVINFYVITYAKQFVFDDIKNLPEKYVVIIPGAKVYGTTISFAARDRAQIAMTCVLEKKAQKILISGDHGQKDYDEVNNIRIFMQKNYGTPDEIIFLDHAGFSTYETMFRAKEIFCVDKAIVATQKFHSYRCVFLARKLGVDAVAIIAPEIVPYTKHIHATWELREFLARVKAFFCVLFCPQPKFLGEKMPITGEAKASWSWAVE